MSRITGIYSFSQKAQHCENFQRYTIAFDGEFYNYRSFLPLRHSCEGRNLLKNEDIPHQVRNDGNDEQQKNDILLQLYIKYGKDFVNKIDGFFALAIFDNQEQTLFVARDTVGGRPLYFFKNDDFFCFSSELNGILAYPVPRKINHTALFCYLQLQYIPAPESIVENVYKLEPGAYLFVTQNGIDKGACPLANADKEASALAYTEAQTQFKTLFENALQKRIENTPKLGAFLSGGIDSSIVCALASQHIQKLPTFSIGFSDNPYFDESKFAELMAQQIGSEHTTLQISQAECAEHIFDILSTFDEPFADSSAIAMYILSKKVASHCSVALSGDGADELFGGYRKHAAHLRLLQPSFTNSLLKTARPFLQHLPQSRNSKLFDIFRKANRYAQTLSLSNADAYWRLCSLQNEEQAEKFLRNAYNNIEYKNLKNSYCTQLNGNISLNDILLADQKLVLANDMMTKADRMSMRNGLEVRTPFLDKNIISFANSLPVDYKIHNSVRKRIVKDSFASFLPAELLNRPKHGFEVPLHTWCTTILREPIENLLSQQFIDEQNIFNWNAIAGLRSKLQSGNPGDAAAQIWALLVFQVWWKKYFS
ncbi:MAG: asparagine synthase (glutamine-hydrolyzing) [Bacteroidetes bacterium]|nr:asparagine synthase (glutamine-hydrolyzing) [Bacteroidota bacterium]